MSAYHAHGFNEEYEEYVEQLQHYQDSQNEEKRRLEEKRQFEELRNGHSQLVEGFSQGSIVFFMTVALTIVSYIISSKAADAVAAKFLPFGGDMRQLVNKFPVVKPFLSKGITVVKSLMGRIVLVSAYARVAAIGIMVFLTLWISNTIVLMAAMYKNCKRVNFKVALRNGLAGAIPSAILTSGALLVIQILSFIPFVLAASIFLVPIATWSTMLIFNLIFGAGIGQAAAIKQGCAPAPAPAPVSAPPT